MSTGKKRALKGGNSSVLKRKPVGVMDVREDASMRERLASGLQNDVSGNVNPKYFAKIPASVKRYFPDAGKKKYLRAGTNQDGSCFYHTLATVINYDGYFWENAKKQREMGRTFRKIMHDTLTRDAWKRFWDGKKVSMDREGFPSLDEIKEQISNPRTWADVFAIMYVCDRLNLNVLVFDLNAGGLYCGTHFPKPGRPTLLMAWVHNAHFEPILEFDTDTLHVRTLFSTRPDGRSILDHILRMYEKEGCPSVTIHEILRRRRRRLRQRRRERRHRRRNSRR